MSLRVVRLGVVGRAADVRGEHDVRPSSRAGGRPGGSRRRSGRARPRRACPTRSAATSASVSCSCARAELTKIAPSFIRANWSAPISPAVSGVTAACIDTTSASASRSSSECVASGGVRVVGDDPHAEPLEPPLRGAARRRRGRRGRPCARRAARPGSAGRGSCRRGTISPSRTSRSALHEPAVDREQERDGDLRDGVGVAARARAAPGSAARSRRRRRRCSGRRGTTRSRRSGRSSTGPFTKSDSTTRRSASASCTDALASFSPSSRRSGVWSIHGSSTTSARPSQRVEPLTAERRRDECRAARSAHVELDDG